MMKAFMSDRTRRDPGEWTSYAASVEAERISREVEPIPAGYAFAGCCYRGPLVLADGALPQDVTAILAEALAAFVADAEAGR